MLSSLLVQQCLLHFLILRIVYVFAAPPVCVFVCVCVCVCVCANEMILLWYADWLWDSLALNLLLS